MSDAKNYAIGIIEIDPVAECQQTWVTLAGDDDTLEEVLARLAGRAPSQGTPAGADAGEGLLGGSAISDGVMASAGRYQPRIRRSGQAPSSTSPEHVAANLTELSADLAERLAEIRSRLATASSA